MNEQDYQFLNIDRAILLSSAGKYDTCIAGLKNISKKWLLLSALPSLIRAHCALGKGMIYEADNFAKRALEESKKGELIYNLHVASFIFAFCHAAMGETKKARAMIRNLNPLLEKSKMEKDLFIRNLLIADPSAKATARFSSFRAMAHPICRMVFLMFKANRTLALSDYRRAFHYALTHSFLGLFHRYIIFFPDLVFNVVNKGKKTLLPRSILKLPVFKKHPYVYKINFLGTIMIYHQKLLHVKFPPKDSALLIYLALYQRSRIPLDQIYQKFWPNSSRPARNLSHTIVRIKKSLKMPTQLLFIQNGHLICGCHFVTDWNEFEQQIVRARALERIDKWPMAQKEYHHAFSLFRGEIFKKMYDLYSEEKRMEILFKLEENLRHYVGEISKRKIRVTNEMKKILKQISILAPQVSELNPTPEP